MLRALLDIKYNGVVAFEYEKSRRQPRRRAGRVRRLRARRAGGAGEDLTRIGVRQRCRWRRVSSPRGLRLAHAFSRAVVTPCLHQFIEPAGSAAFVRGPNPRHHEFSAGGRGRRAPSLYLCMTASPARPTLGFGIVGVGMIADYHAQAIADTNGGKPRAASARATRKMPAPSRKNTACRFRPRSVEELVARPDIHVVLHHHTERRAPRARAGRRPRGQARRRREADPRFRPSEPMAPRRPTRPACRLRRFSRPGSATGARNAEGGSDAGRFGGSRWQALT